LIISTLHKISLFCRVFPHDFFFFLAFYVSEVRVDFFLREKVFFFFLRKMKAGNRKEERKIWEKDFV